MFSDDTDNDPGFWLHRPEDVRAALFELTHPDSHVLVRDAGDRELAVVIRSIDRGTQTFTWAPRDYAGSDFSENERGVPPGEVFDVLGNGYSGVRIRFRIPRPELVREDDGTPVLLSPFPERLARVQRRRSFRAQATPASLPRAFARWTPADGGRPVEFRIRDLSIDGIGLRSSLPVADLPEPGTILEDVTLDFGDAGTLVTTLEVRNAYALGRQDEAKPDETGSGSPAQGALPATSAVSAAVPASAAASISASAPAPGTAPARRASGASPLSHLGAVFVDLSPREETWLQQIVWRLEKQRGSR